MARIESRAVQACVADYRLAEHQPVVSQPFSAASNGTTNNATQSVLARERSRNNINKPLPMALGRKHRRLWGQQAVSLASLELAGGRRVAVDGFSCPRPPAARAGRPTERGGTAGV